MLHTVLFDIGGTLLDAPDIFETLSKVFPKKEKEAAILIRNIFMNIYSGIANQEIRFITIEEMIRKTLFQVSVALEYEDKSGYAKELYWDNFVNNGKLCDDTIEVLNDFKNNHIRMIVASDADAPSLYEQFRRNNIMHFFDRCIISSEIKAYKPSELFVSAIKKSISGDLNGILFVGDSNVDIITGKKLGVPTALKGNSKNHEILPDFEISSLKELIALKHQLGSCDVH